MNLDAIGVAGAWLIAALVLGIAELLIPGVFLVFVALAAAMTGLELLAAPALPAAVQLASVAVWTALGVGIGRRWYRDYPVGGDDRLNQPAMRLVGGTVMADGAFVDGRGRVRVGDGSWPARSAAPVAAGERLRILALDAGTLVVAPAEQSPASSGPA